MIKENIEIYKEYRNKIKAFNYVEALISWDKETQAPLKSANFRANQIEVLSNIIYEIKNDEKYINSINYLYKNNHKIEDELLRIEIRQQ